MLLGNAQHTLVYTFYIVFQLVAVTIESCMSLTHPVERYAESLY